MAQTAIGVIFTFHYVSIKSTTQRAIDGVNYKFTFHYVSIKSKKSVNTIAREVYLHSTMYLLNQQAQMIEC